MPEGTQRAIQGQPRPVFAQQRYANKKALDGLRRRAQNQHGDYSSVNGGRRRMFTPAKTMPSCKPLLQAAYAQVKQNVKAAYFHVSPRKFNAIFSKSTHRFYIAMFRDLTDIMFRATAAALAVSALAVLFASSFGL